VSVCESERIRFGHKGTFISPYPMDCVLRVITCRLYLKLDVILYFIYIRFLGAMKN
jgi:hypothetical protein